MTLACRIAGSLAQPSTLTTLAANGPPSCAASARGTTNSAKSTIDGDLAGRVRGAGAGRVRAALDGREVQRPQQIAIDQLQRHARLARRADRVGVAERLLQPGAPVVGAARRAHAAAAVVVQHRVVGGEHRLVEERLQRQLAIAVRDDVEDVAVKEELRDRSRSEQVAHLGGPGGERHVGVGARSVQLAGARLRGQRRRVGNQVVHGADRLLLIGDPLAGGAERGADLVDPLRQVLGIGREHGLLADQLDLLLDPRQLRVEERELLIGFAAPGDALLEQVGLALRGCGAGRR